MRSSTTARHLSTYWLRGTRRRPGRAVVVVLGVVLMSTATCAALVGGDLLERLFVDDARAEWGTVDLEVRAEDNAVHTVSTGRLVEAEGPGEVVAAAPRLVLTGAVQVGEVAVPDVLVLGLGAEELGMGPLTSRDGSSDGVDRLLRLEPGEVIVNERLAQRSSLEPGDHVVVAVAVPRWLETVPDRDEPFIHQPITVHLDVVVADVVRDEGVADLHRTANVLLRLDHLARAAGMDGRATVTHVRLTDRDVATARHALDGLADLTAVHELDVDAVLQDELVLAEDDGGLFRSILLTMSMLVTAAAVVAIRGLLLALADERAPEIATLRAVGVRAAVVRRLLTVEGAVLGLIGAVLGAAAGVPAGTWISRLLVDHFADLNTGRGREQVALDPKLSAAPLVIGVAVTVVVVLLAARAAGRMVAEAEIAPVLRGGQQVATPRPPRPARRTASLVVGGALLGAGAAVGGSVVFIGATILLGRWWTDRRQACTATGTAEEPTTARDRLDQRAAMLGLLWATVGAALLTDPADGVQAGMGTLIVAGLVAIGCGAVLVVPRLRSVASVLRGYVPSGAAQVALATAAATATRDARRSAVTVVTVGSTLFMVAALSVLGSSQALPLEQQSGGFDVVVRSVSALEPNELLAIDGVAAATAVPVATLPQANYSVGPDDGPRLSVVYPVRMVAASQAFADLQEFALAAGADGIGSSRAALRTIAVERGSAVVDRAALPEGAKVGDVVVIETGDREQRLRLVGVLDTYLLRAVIAHPVDMAAVTELRLPGLAYVRAGSMASPDTLSQTIVRELDRPGVVAEPLAQVRQDVIAVNQTFTDTFSIMLLLALAVSVGSVAAHVVRAGRVRRGELALLRAAGLRRRAVVATLALEPLLAALVGCLLGLVLGLGLLRGLFSVGFGDLAFVVRWGALGAIAGSTLLALALVSWLAAAVSVPRELDAALRDRG